MYLVAEEAQRGDHILRGGIAHERNTVHILSFPAYFPCKTFGLFLVYSPACGTAVGAIAEWVQISYSGLCIQPFRSMTAGF